MKRNQIMGKIFLCGLFGVIGMFDFSFAQNYTTPSASDYIPSNKQTTTNPSNYVETKAANTSTTAAGYGVASKESATTVSKTTACYSSCSSTCPFIKDSSGKITTTQEAICLSSCKSRCEGTLKQNIVDPADQRVMGITMGPKCLKNGQCGFNIYEFLGFEGKSNDPTLFVQDILLSASFFIGTVITIALIYSGFLFVMAGATGKDPSNAKNGIKYSIIGLLIVICSYSLIRLVQYIAKGL